MPRFYGTSKMGNRWHSYGNHKFQSKLEMERYKFLEKMEGEERISFLSTQTSFTLIPAFTTKHNVHIRACTYRADFVYYIPEYAIWVIEDSKGFETDHFKIKKKLIELLLLQPQYDQFYFVITKKPHEEIRDPRIPRTPVPKKRRTRYSHSEL